MKSNAPNGGSFYHSPDPTGGFQEYRDTPAGVIANDDGNEFANDKELMTADANPSSPKKDNVYMTWTRFNADESQPDLLQPVDGRRGELVDPIEISGSNAAICPPGGGPCNDDQGSDPVVGPGRHDLRSFSNGNVPGNGIEQVLNVKCPVQRRLQQPGELDWPDEGRRHDLDPAGRPAEPERLPEPAVPTAERLPRSRRDDRDQLGRPERKRVRDVGGSPQQHEPELRAGRGRRRILAVRPRHLLRVLHGRRVDVERHEGRHATLELRRTAQWQPWSEVTNDGSRLWVAFYDRHYGNCETTGCNDITAAQIKNPASNHPNFSYTRVTTSSMPNLTAGEQPGAGRLPGRLHVGRHRPSR